MISGCPYPRIRMLILFPGLFKSLVLPSSLMPGIQYFRHHCFVSQQASLIPAPQSRASSWPPFPSTAPAWRALRSIDFSSRDSQNLGKAAKFALFSWCPPVVVSLLSSSLSSACCVLRDRGAVSWPGGFLHSPYFRPDQRVTGSEANAGLVPASRLCFGAVDLSSICHLLFNFRCLSRALELGGKAPCSMLCSVIPAKRLASVLPGQYRS
ncbi:hypothetical protein J3F83DRAFT_241837 [Trichoderma novae-zelandiae]